MTRVEIAALPLADRLQMMEQLWDSLSETNSAIPTWHTNVLHARAKALDDGSEVISEWPEVKARLRARSEKR